MIQLKLKPSSRMKFPLEVGTYLSTNNKGELIRSRAFKHRKFVSLEYVPNKSSDVVVSSVYLPSGLSVI